MKEIHSAIELLDKYLKSLECGKLELHRPHPAQEPFHRSQKLLRLIVAGNRWGKTTASVVEAIWRCLGIHPYIRNKIPQRGKMYGESYSIIDDTYRLKFEALLPRSVLADSRPYVYNNQGNLIGINFKNGSLIKIGTYDQADAKSEGSNWDFVAFDEPPRRDLYIANLRGCVDTGGVMWFSMTPLREPWIYDQLWLPSIEGRRHDVECFAGATSDNPYNDPKGVQAFFDELTPEERDVRFYGNFTTIRGLVISTYNRMHNVDPFLLDHRYSIYEGIDPHPSKPHSALWKAIDESGNRYVVRELLCEGGVLEFADRVCEIRKELECGGAVVVRSVCDTSFNQKDPAYRINLKDEFNGRIKQLVGGVFTNNVQKKEKREWVFDGIMKLKDLYRGDPPKQRVFRNCTNYIYELGHYQWSESENGKPVSRYNDLIDCDRYIESVAPMYQAAGLEGFVRTYNGAYQRFTNESLSY